MKDKNKYDFTDEETDLIIQELIQKIRDEAARRRENPTESCYVMSPDDMSRMYGCESALRRIIKGSDIMISSKTSGSSLMTGDVCVLGTDIVVMDPPFFLQLVRSADTFEFLPRTDGSVEMNFSYFNLTRSLKEVRGAE